MFVKTKVKPSYALANVQKLLVSNSHYHTIKEDEIGVEIELEGEQLNEAYDKLRETGCDYWKSKADGSLQNGREFVFTKALNRVYATKAIKDFFKVFNKEATIKLSSRCSTHMHLNFQQMSMLQAYNFMTLFYALEQPLFLKYAPERIGNQYCKTLFNKDSQAVQHNEKDLKSGRYAMASYDRFVSLNMSSLSKYGSLECRMLGGSDNAEKPLEWMEILLELYDYVKAFPRLTPADILNNLENPASFIRETFPKIWNGIKDLPNIDKMLLMGVDSISDFAYAVDWTPAKTSEPPEEVTPTNVDESGYVFDNEYEDEDDYDDDF